MHKLAWVYPELVADSGFGNTANSDLVQEEQFKKIVRKTLQYYLNSCSLGKVLHRYLP